MLFKLLTRGELNAEIYACNSDDALAIGKIVKVVDINDGISATFKVATAADNEQYVAAIVRVDEFNSKKGSVLDFTMNRGLIFETDNYDASDFATWTSGDLVGVKDGKFHKVDGTTITNAVAKVIKVKSNSAVLQVI